MRGSLVRLVGSALTFSRLTIVGAAPCPKSQPSVLQNTTQDATRCRTLLEGMGCSWMETSIDCDGSLPSPQSAITTDQAALACCCAGMDRTGEASALEVESSEEDVQLQKVMRTVQAADSELTSGLSELKTWVGQVK